MDAWLEETVQLEVDQAKLIGLEATRKAINSWNHNKEYNWQLMTVSNQTASKLVTGEFKTFEEFENFSFDSMDVKDVEILYRRITNPNTEDFNYIIETIFIDE